jgi:hypothetical protein
MNLVERVKNILLTPKEEWAKIGPEPATVQSLYVGYIMILAAIGPVALLVRSFGLGIAVGIVTYVVALAMAYLMALIVDALAPTFGGEKNFMQSLKLVAYSYTATWVAGIFQILGVLAGLIGILALIYSFYTFYLGVTTMKKCPQDKAAAYTIVVLVCGLVLGVVLGGVLMSMLFGGAMMGMGATGLFH